ncbi:MAG: hypothetical protein JO011_04270, partial [Ktedonobacteraceae bacterium]|nr:hypothetical protein [Ktedonobacteraceae bacterium]
ALLKRPRTVTAPRVQADARELYVNDPQRAGYSIDAEGASWVRGAQATFNATKSHGVPFFPDQTYVLLTNASGSQLIQAGVLATQGGITPYMEWLDWDDSNPPLGGYISADFSVRPGDQVNVEVWEDTRLGAHSWTVFIQDVNTKAYQYFAEGDTTDLTRADWVLDTGIDGNPVAPRFPTLVGFSQAQWISNWAGWVPISSSAGHTYTQITNVSPSGGIIETTELSNAGEDFALVPCPGCHA